MDKNKDVYKLQGLPPLYYINLDGTPERNEYIKNHLEYWGVEDYTRISGNDGRDDDLSHLLKGRYPDNMSSSEVGCATTHLKAIKYWMETSDSPCAIVAEDDLDLSVVSYWNFSWKDFYSLIPYDYDVVQLVIISPETLHSKLHKRFVNDFSCAAYLITRRHAEKLLGFHTIGDHYKLDNGVKPKAVADELIYNTGITYSISIWSYNSDLASSIHQEHVDLLHKPNLNTLLELWKVNGAKLDIREMMDYDPYYDYPNFINKELKKSNLELSDSNEALNSINKKLDKSNTELNKANQILNSINKDLDKSNTELNKANQILNSINKKLVKENFDLRKKSENE